MPTTSDFVDHAIHLGPWLVGIFISIIGLAVRNEWTTAKMERALFDKNGDLRLMKTNDCDHCRNQCQAAFQKALEDAKCAAEKERAEVRADILRIHTKIDELPERIIVLLRGFNGQAPPMNTP